MKQIMVWLLLLATTYAQVPDIVLEVFDWPDPVAQGMATETTYPSQTIVLDYDRYMSQSYNISTNQLKADVLLRKGLTIDVWRFDHDNTRYFLINDQGKWYWTTLSQSRSQATAVSQVPIKYNHQPDVQFDKLSLGVQYGYWHAVYGDKVASSRFSVYIAKRFDWNSDFGKFIISPGLGLTIKHRPADSSPTTPMYRFRLTCDWRLQAISYYATASYFKSITTQLQPNMELYSKLSWRLPAHLDHFRVNFVYFGSEPTDHSWSYSEGKLQAVYHIGQWWLGIEPFVASRWDNIDGWISESRSKPGNIVVGAWADNYWFELSYGRYRKESGKQPNYEHWGNENHISFSIGTKLRR